MLSKHKAHMADLFRVLITNSVLIRFKYYDSSITTEALQTSNNNLTETIAQKEENKTSLKELNGLEQEYKNIFGSSRSASDEKDNST